MNHALRRTSICLALAAILHDAAASATEPTPGLPTIYVAANGGSDANPGTAQEPKASIGAALAAIGTTAAQVFVAEGIYSGPVSLRSGVSLFGGYDRATWTRDPARVTSIQSAAEALVGNN